MAILAFLLGAMPAHAVLITNKDSQTRTVVIDEGGDKSRHEIAPTSSLDGVCLKGCVAELEGMEDGAYRLPEGNEIVTIEDGVMYYEGASPPKKDEETALPAGVEDEGGPPDKAQD